MGTPCEHRWTDDPDAPSRLRSARCGVTAPVPMAKTPPAPPSRLSNRDLQRVATFAAPAVLLGVVVLVAVGKAMPAILVLMIAGWGWLSLTLMFRWERTAVAPPKARSDA